MSAKNISVHQWINNVSAAAIEQSPPLTSSPDVFGLYLLSIEILMHCKSLPLTTYA